MGTADSLTVVEQEYYTSGFANGIPGNCRHPQGQEATLTTLKTLLKWKTVVIRETGTRGRLETEVKNSSFILQ